MSEKLTIHIDNCKFVPAMKKFIIGILIGFVAIFCLNEISDKRGQLSSSVQTVTEQYADDAEHTCELSSHSRQTLANEWRFSFEDWMPLI